jgi:dTDP-4-dehydrorhamnose reductase
MKIVLFGKNGQLGWEFQQVLPTLGDVVQLGHSDLNVSDIPTLQSTLKQLKPDLIINASAYTEVDLAEKNREKAYQVNAVAPGSMAESARRLNAVFIHYSTDYVFDGMGSIPYKENHPTHPVNVYGWSKLKGEESIRETGDAFLILRTSWVYSMRGNSFVNKVLGWARKSKSLKIVDDQVSNPTWARSLAKITCRMLLQQKEDLFENIRRKQGIYHLAGSGYASRYEWAKQILINASSRNEQLARTIEPVSSEEFPTPAKRPYFTALDCSKFNNTFGLRLPNWEDSLSDAMQNREYKLP